MQDQNLAFEGSFFTTGIKTWNDQLFKALNIAPSRVKHLVSYFQHVCFTCIKAK